MNILLTNDDGIFAEGINFLAETIKPLGDIYTVAPNGNRSCSAHSMSFHKRIYFERLYEKKYSLDAFPVDCVFAALKGFFKNVDFDLVISGINHGANVGTDVFYSGTVSAAFRAAEEGIDSIAFSSARAVPPFIDTSFSDLIIKIISTFLENKDIIKQRAIKYAKEKFSYYQKRDLNNVNVILNVNFPDFTKQPSNNIFATILEPRLYDDDVVFENCTREDPEGYFEFVGKLSEKDSFENTDLYEIKKGNISISPFFYILPGMLLLIPNAIEGIF
jgi:5'-nucleotidase